MGKLRAQQETFCFMVAKLIAFAFSRGYTMTFGHAFRCQECPVGKKDSLHKERLAVDLNLFIDGEYKTATKDYKELGEFWEDMGGAWGGHFGDGNHFSHPLPGDDRK